MCVFNSSNSNNNDNKVIIIINKLLFVFGPAARPPSLSFHFNLSLFLFPALLSVYHLSFSPARRWRRRHRKCKCTRGTRHDNSKDNNYYYSLSVCTYIMLQVPTDYNTASITILNGTGNGTYTVRFVLYCSFTF